MCAIDVHIVYRLSWKFAYVERDIKSYLDICLYVYIMCLLYEFRIINAYFCFHYNLTEIDTMSLYIY